MKELVWRNIFIPAGGHSLRSNFKKYHLQSRTSLTVYSDIFTRIGKFPSAPYKFQLKPNVKPSKTCAKVSSYSPAGSIPSGNLKFGTFRKFWSQSKKLLNRINSFVIMEKKVPVDSSNAHSPQHSVQKKTQDLP